MPKGIAWEEYLDDKGINLVAGRLRRNPQVASIALSIFQMDQQGQTPNPTQ